MKNDTEDIDRQKTESSESNSSHYKALTINYELYEQYLENSDLTEVQKREFLDALWNIIIGFVDLGFGVHPISQTCAQNAKLSDFLTSDTDHVVKSKNHMPRTDFSKSAKRCQIKPAERLEP